ncbi:DUF4260 domain-containing protein [Asticcacaulis solisilvae]|uniref:DUF4260 domain-containing protein n=1 Tax=Asticcacaulis solisilvae TaxID=1217274 RepID=UPI003FD7A98A
MSGTVTGAPKALLRLEGLFVLIAACAAYAHTGGNWWLFAALFLAPDLSMLGYMAGRKAGAALYNLGHWYAAPLACLAWGVFGQSPLALDIGLIWMAHIGFDRTLGYGLKYADGFGATHLGLKGKAARAAQCRTAEAV